MSQGKLYELKTIKNLGTRRLFNLATDFFVSFFSKKNESRTNNIYTKAINMSISNFIEASIQHFENHTYDISLALVASAVDATATKSKYKGNNNVKYKKFLKDNMRIITTFGFPGISASAIKIKCHNIKDLKTDKNNMVNIEDIIYHTIRCGLIHQCDISNSIEFTEKTYIGDFIDTFKIPQNLVLGLIMSVVLAECNKNEKLSTNVYTIINPISQEELIINNLWGFKNSYIL